MRFKHVWLALALIAASFRPALADQPETIRIAAIGIYAGGQLQLSGIDSVIESQGWLKSELAKHGVKFEWYPVSNAAVGPLVNEGFASHAIQFASYGDLPAIIINGSAEKTTTELLASGSPRDAYLTVPANSDAKSIEDLQGKRLAIHRGRPWELPLLHLLDSKGLSYSDFQIYNINPDAGAAAVASGAVDGLFTITAYPLEEKGVAKIIWSTKNAPVSWKMGMGFWGAKDFIEKYPELTQIVVTAYVKAAYWASQDENRDAMIKLETLNGTSEKAARLTYDDPSISWRQRWSPLFSQATEEHYKDTIAYAADKKIIRRGFDAADLFNDSFTRAAVKELNLESYWASPTQAGLAPGQ